MSQTSTEGTFPYQRMVAHNVLHMRAEPKSGSELVSQTLGGRTVTVLKEENGWGYIQSDDTYRGWSELRLLTAPDVSPTVVSTPFAEIRSEPGAPSLLLERLSLLCGVFPGQSNHGDWIPVTVPGSEKLGWLHSEALKPLPQIPADTIGVAAARYGQEFRGTPYLWGGSSSFGLDCSGFVQLCYRLCGVILRRDADIQRSDPRFFHVEQKELQPGDLVFFGNPDKITHVGMHLEGKTFIHSAGGVGVILSEWGDDRYSPGYVDARRLDLSRANEPVTRHEDDKR